MELAILTDEISMDLDEAVKEGKAFGFKKYELRCIDDFPYRVPYFKPGRAEQLKSLVDNGDLCLTAVTPGLFKIFPSEADNIKRELEETLPATCEIAVSLGAPRVIVFGFMREENGDLDKVRESLNRAAEITKRYNLTLCVENEPGSYCDTGQNTAAFVKSMENSDIRINWDPANAIVSGEVAYPIGYEAILPYLENVHIKDAIPLPPDKWENRLIGDGGMNWLGQLRRLLNDRPVKHLTLETHVFPLLENTREDLRRLKILWDTASKFNESTEY